MFLFCRLFKHEKFRAGIQLPVVFVLLFLAVNAWSQESKSDNVKELYDTSILKAEKAWKSKVDRLLSYSGVMTVSMQMNGSSPNSETAPVLAKTRGEWSVVFPDIVFDNEALSGDDEIGTQVAFGCNKKYLFGLEKNAPSDQWTIDRVEPALKRINSDGIWDFLTNSSNSDEQLADLYRLLSRTVLSEFILPDNETSIVALTSSPLCEANRFETLDGGALRMYFTVKEAENDGGNAEGVKTRSFPFRSGSIDFASDDWRVLAATLSYGKWEESMQCDYNLDGEIPTLVSKKIKTTYGDGKFTEDEFTYNMSKKSFDSTRFTLTHYGLPEPEFGTTGVSWIRWILLAVGLFAIGWGVWRFYRERLTSQ